jgi:hypothetical protein
VTSNSVDSVKEPSPDVQVSVSVEERKDTLISAPSGDRSAEIENNAISPRSGLQRYVFGFKVNVL